MVRLWVTNYRYQKLPYWHCRYIKQFPLLMVLSNKFDGLYISSVFFFTICALYKNYSTSIGFSSLFYGISITVIRPIYFLHKQSFILQWPVYKFVFLGNNLPLTFVWQYAFLSIFQKKNFVRPFVYPTLTCICISLSIIRATFIFVTDHHGDC